MKLQLPEACSWSSVTRAVPKVVLVMVSLSLMSWTLTRT